MNSKWLVVLAACAALGMAGATPAVASDAEAGAAKAKRCAACHGADGKGKKNNPPLAGYDAAKFVKVMQDYKSGTKKHKMMNNLAKKMNDTDFANRAAYYASLK